MKLAIVLLTALISTSLWAAPKDAKCTEYLNLASTQGQDAVPLPLLVDTLNIAWELQFNKVQTDKLMMAITGAMENNPEGKNNIHKSAYFACTTTLDADDIAQARKSFKEAIGE